MANYRRQTPQSVRSIQCDLSACQYSNALGGGLSMIGNSRRPNALRLSCTAKAYAILRPVARRLPPRRLASARMQFAADVTPREFCSAEPLQRRIEAGP